jgi:eukaryotic-like serine/threonine-protein kinase
VEPPAAEFTGTERFQVRRRIGAGGMGVVYQAFDVERGVEVALKTVERLDPRAIYLLKREFRSLADLSHPNLVTLHELVSAHGHWFFTMELVDGVDFLSYVWGEPSHIDPQTLPVDRAWFEISRPEVRSALGTTPQAIGRLKAALSQLVEGVLAVHESGKLHRDIKPSNVLVAPGGRVVLLDFGLITDRERGESGASMDHLVVGTADYMSPEQAASKPLTPASDWYSVGTMLYHALTGVLPFTGRPLQILLAKQETVPPPPRELAPEVPPELDALCCELLRRDPGARPDGPSLLERLGGGGGAIAAVGRTSSSSAGRGAPFVGRDPELAELWRAFEEARLGYATLVHVRGGSGIGKTHLVRRFLQEVAAREEATLLAGRCCERESVPYKALDSLIDALSRHLTMLPPAQAKASLPADMQALVRVFPVLRRVEAATLEPWRPIDVSSPQELRRRASLALCELLTRLTEQQPVVIHLDDLQWGDVDSASLLEDLVSAASPPAVLLIASYRSEDVERSPFLQALRGPARGMRRRARVHVLELAPLSREESQLLAAQLVNDRDAAHTPQVAALALESGGNPFFLW